MNMLLKVCRFSVAFIFGLVFSLAILAPSLFPALASALTYQSSVDVEFHVNSYLDLYVGGNLTIDDLNPSQSDESSPIAVSVSTNSGYGYYLSATVGTSSTNTNLTHTTDSNYTFASLTSNAATLNAIPENRWGYSYSTDDGTTWISGSKGNTQAGYNGLPLDNDDDGATGVVLDGGDAFTPGTSLQFKIAAHASATQPSGTYTNVVNFYAVANPEPTLAPVSCNPGKICYNVNSLTRTEGTMGEQSATDGTTATLLASNFSRTGYGFAGWSDAYDYATNPYANLYGPQEDITVPTGTTANGLSLYAIWIKSAGSLQDATKVIELCGDGYSTSGSLTPASSAYKTLSSVSALTDQRDNQTYAIAKLADGKCWMIENLRIEATDTRGDTNKGLAQGYGRSTAYGNFAGLADAESTGFTTTYSPNSMYSNDGSNGTINVGNTNYPAYRIPRYNNLNTSTRAQNNPNSNRFTEDNTTGGMYSYGNYYTWNAAMANTTIYNGPTGRDANGETSETVNTSLCPSMWRLPYGRDTGNGNVPGGYYYLNYKLNDDANVTDSTASLKMRSFPNNFLYSGLFNSASANGRGNYGFYWTSTVYDYYDSYNVSLYSNALNQGTYPNDNFLGFSVRCVIAEILE